MGVAPRQGDVRPVQSERLILASVQAGQNATRAIQGLRAIQDGEAALKSEPIR